MGKPHREAGGGRGGGQQRKGEHTQHTHLKKNQELRVFGSVAAGRPVDSESRDEDVDDHEQKNQTCEQVLREVPPPFANHSDSIQL